MIVQPGPLIDFLIANQNARDPFHLDWTKVLICALYHIYCVACCYLYGLLAYFSQFLVKAKRVLKNLRIKARPSNIEFKINGLSDKPCNELT